MQGLQGVEDSRVVSSCMGVLSHSVRNALCAGHSCASVLLVDAAIRGNGVTVCWRLLCLGCVTQINSVNGPTNVTMLTI